MNKEETNREEYIFAQAKELKSLRKKIDKISDNIMNGDLTYNRRQKLEADLNWACMHREMCKERIGYVLGHFNINDLREFYEPSGWHKYNGIRGEVERLKFT